MRADYGELERLRERLREIENGSVTTEETSGRVSLLARTRSVGSYPSAALKVYSCEILHVMGAETEGATPTKYPTGVYIFAANLGTAVPAQGTEVLLTYQPHTWTFQHD